MLLLRAQSRLGDRGIKKLVDLHGSACGALKGTGVQGDLLRPFADLPPELSSLQEGEEVLPMTSPRYPASLLELTDPPPLLFLKGMVELLHEPAVAIVGSRQATEAGRRTAETMGRRLAQVGITVVSGLALGIDGAAHRGALAVGGKTVAVLGSGLRTVYPRSHHALFREVGERGLLASEFSPGEPALPHHFPRRNRIIAALSRAVVVVEAGKRSGALITVDHGLDLGKDILVVPGSVESPRSQGSNALLREGARAIPDPESIVDELRELGLEPPAPSPGAAQSQEEGEGVPRALRDLWAALSPEPMGVDEVALQAEVSVTEALAGLSALELGGWVRQCPGMRFQRR